MYANSQDVRGPFSPKITVIGVGGAGGNAVNNMIASKLEGVSFLTCNTDAQALENSLASKTIQLGTQATGGLGAGARPEIGRTAAEETLPDIEAELDGVNMVFITAGMGGGTGTGAAPVIARAAKEKGILTVGVVTKPFQFEGAQRMRLAEAGIDELAQYVDTLIVIPNQNLFRIANEKTTFAEAFRMADNVLQSGVRGVTDLMVVPGMINLDFADVRSATSEMGKAMMGTGEASGDRRAVEAAEQAINNPLLDDLSMKGARSVIINVAGGHDLTLFEIEEACNRITDEVDPDATIIFGSTYDDSLEGSMRITVVATGIEAEINRRAASRPVRPVNVGTYQQQAAQPVEVKNEETSVTDGFHTRYPEPSRVVNGGASMASPAATPYVPADGGQGVAQPYAAEPMVQTPAAAVASADQAGYVAEQQGAAVTMTEPSQPQQGFAQTEYVTEGAAVRKVETQIQEQQQPQQGSGLIPAFAPPRDQQPKMESSMTLTPPVQPNMLEREQRKTPSLFERITGARTRDDLNGERGEGTGGQASSGSAGNGSFLGGLRAERKTVVSSYDAPSEKGMQGTLNVDVPKPQAKTSTPVSGDDLDIPAFLRRQIS